MPRISVSSLVSSIRAVDDQFAVAQDRHPVGKVEHLLQPVADIDDGDAARLEPADQREELAGLLPREVGGRLVEDQELGAAQSPRARWRPVVAGRWSGWTSSTPGREAEADLVEYRLRFAHHRTMLQQAPPDLLVAEEQIRGDRQVAAQHHLLMHRVDAERDRIVRRR